LESTKKGVPVHMDFHKKISIEKREKKKKLVVRGAGGVVGIVESRSAEDKRGLR